VRKRKKHTSLLSHTFLNNQEHSFPETHGGEWKTLSLLMGCFMLFCLTKRGEVTEGVTEGAGETFKQRKKKEKEVETNSEKKEVHFSFLSHFS